MKSRIIISILLCAVIGFFTLCTKKEPIKTTGGEFKITNLVFCSEEPEGYMKYNEQPDAKYKPGDVVWIYMNLTNVKYNTNPDGSYKVHIPEHLVVKSPGGEILLDLNFLNEPISFSKEHDMNQVFLTNNINTVEGLEDGEYEVDITIADKLSNRSARTTAKFHLKK